MKFKLEGSLPTQGTTPPVSWPGESAGDNARRWVDQSRIKNFEEAPPTRTAGTSSSARRPRWSLFQLPRGGPPCCILPPWAKMFPLQGSWSSLLRLPWASEW
jgi:hypothetical protein